MTDRDTDRTRSTAGRTAEPVGAGTEPRADNRQGAQRQAGSHGDESAAESLKDAGSRVADEAKGYAQDMAGRAKEQGRSMFEQQKDNAAQQVDSVASAFRNTAGQLRGDGQSQASRFIGAAAERLESLGHELRQKDMDTLLRDAENLGRRAPATFFAGSVLAGFMLARFLKSSGASRRTAAEDWRGDVARDRDDYSESYSRDGTGEYRTDDSDLSQAAARARGGDEATRETQADLTGRDPVSDVPPSGAPLGADGAAAGSKGGIGADGTGTGGTGGAAGSPDGTRQGGNTYGNR